LLFSRGAEKSQAALNAKIEINAIIKVFFILVKPP
jgi:hypothetical protein